jgi:outer membrane immunogenic protein
MKGFVGALVALALGSAVAAAADMPVKAPPPPVPILNWTGIYVGINGGVAAMNGPSMSYVDGAINAYVPVTVDPSNSSVKAIAGVHAGFDYQLNGSSFVVGAEVDWDWTNLKNSAATGLLCSGPPFRGQCGGVRALSDNAFFQTSVNWLASARGRVGYAWNQWMVYATGGTAFADVNYTGNLNCTGVIPTFCLGGGQFMRSSASETRVGGVVGAGFEFKPARNWVLGAEYLYYHFSGDGSSTASWNFAANGAPAPFFECATGQNCGQFTYRGLDIQTGRVRLSYQFQP